MDTSRALRFLVATAIVSALAILMTSTAQARWVDEGSGAPVSAPVVGNPGDGAQVPTPVLGNPGDGAQVQAADVEPTAAASGSGGFDGGTTAVIAGGAVLVALGAGALLLATRHRRVALP